MKRREKKCWKKNHPNLKNTNHKKVKQVDYKKKVVVVVSCEECLPAAISLCFASFSFLSFFRSKSIDKINQLITFKRFRVFYRLK